MTGDSVELVLLKVPTTSIFFISSSDCIYLPMNVCEKNSIWVKCNFFIKFETVQIWGHFGPPFAPVSSWFGMCYDVNSGTRDFRLDPSRLLYLCKFNLVHAKFWKGAFCMDYQAKFTEVNQARWVKPKVTFLNLRHNSEHVGTGSPQENSISRFLKIHKKIALYFYSNRKFFSQKSIA